MPQPEHRGENRCAQRFFFVLGHHALALHTTGHAAIVDLAHDQLHRQLSLHVGGHRRAVGALLVLGDGSVDRTLNLPDHGQVDLNDGTITRLARGPDRPDLLGR